MNSNNNYISHLEVNGKRTSLEINKVYCIGYSGRDREKTQEHIKELAEIGVPEPHEIPTLFPVSVNTITQNNVIEVLGDNTSGEAEIVLIFGNQPDQVYLTVGSDHTDRDLETFDINKSKQVCGKPFATKAWKVSNVKEHWDKLVLSSSLLTDGDWQKYQHSPIESILNFDQINSFLTEKKLRLTNCIVFCGTVPLIEGFKIGDSFHMKLEDPILQDFISSEYKIQNLLREGSD